MKPGQQEKKKRDKNTYIERKIAFYIFSGQSDFLFPNPVCSTLSELSTYVSLYINTFIYSLYHLYL